MGAGSCYLLRVRDLVVWGPGSGQKAVQDMGTNGREPADQGLAATQSTGLKGSKGNIVVAL